MPYKLSPSSLNLLNDCPRCFWLQLNKNIKRPAGVFPSLPSGMDRILKAHFDSFMEKNKLPPELKELTGIKLLNNKELLTVWRNNLKGIQYTDEKGNILRGAVDNILVKQDKLIVMDYKTRGFPLKEDTAEHYHNQLNIYNFLLRKNSYETEDYAYLLFYYPKEVRETGEIIFDTELIKVKTDIKSAENLFRKAIHLLESPMPSPSESCEYCKWKEQVI